jgi:hypothetical protein
MSGEDPFRLEWAMAFDVSKRELLPCFCYELTRECLRDAKRRKPDFVWGLPVWEWQGEVFWVDDFERPYLALNVEDRKRIQKAYPSYRTKNLNDIIRESIRAKRPDVELPRSIAFWRSLHEGGKPQGRAALPAKLRTRLKYLGARRVLQKYRWNNNPTDLFHSQREWNNAKRQAERMMEFWILIIQALLINPPD